MKTFKIIDTGLSLALITGYAITWSYQPDKLFEAYFVVGGWQSCSMIVHALRHCFTRKGGTRYVYHWISFVALVTLPLGSYWILFFLAPVMALFYTGLCLAETRKMAPRPLTVLK